MSQHSKWQLLLLNVCHMLGRQMYLGVVLSVLALCSPLECPEGAGRSHPLGWWCSGGKKTNTHNDALYNKKRHQSFAATISHTHTHTHSLLTGLEKTKSKAVWLLVQKQSYSARIHLLLYPLKPRRGTVWPDHNSVHLSEERTKQCTIQPAQINFLALDFLERAALPSLINAINMKPTTQLDMQTLGVALHNC